MASDTIKAKGEVDLSTLAGRLTKAERDCILGNPDRLEASTATLLCLCLSDAADVRRDNSVALTLLGLALRQHLMEGRA